MLLAHRFPNTQLNLTLELFLRMLKDFFGNSLISVVLYGSILFDDLAPDYGDLDFLAVVDEELSDEARKQLAELRKSLRSGDYGIFAEMIEGAFLPRKMLDPAIDGMAFWWGTSGERDWSSNQLGWFVLHVIRERGLIIYGKDIKHEIPPASRDNLIQEIKKFCESTEEHRKGGGLHSIDWLLTTARLMLWLREGRLSSKSEAADWGVIHAKGEWRNLLSQAKQIRLNPAIADSPEVKEWLESLTISIKEACEELQNELDNTH